MARFLAIPSELAALAARHGYAVEFRSTTYTRGWPNPSRRPYLLRTAGDVFLASFPTLAGLERSMRARAGL